MPGFHRQVLDDPPRQRFADFPVPGHGLHRARDGVSVEVVLASVPDQHAAPFLKRSDQVNAVHGIVNSPTRRTPSSVGSENMR
jgi:hypothetical protein